MGGNPHIPSLDGIRGVAVLIVFAAHAGLEQWVPGGFGVTVFFFLSGYLITTLLRLELARTGGVSLKNFYLRRLFRIFPPMYLVLCLCLLFAAFTSRTLHAGPILGQFLHLTNYIQALGDPRDLAPFTAPFWSLAVEEHFYLVFPPLLLLLARRLEDARIALVLGAACAAVLLWRLYLVIVLDVDPDYVYMASDTRVDSILYGCLLAVWRNPKDDRSIAPPAAAALLLGGCLLLIASLLIRESVFRDTLRYSIQGIALLPIFYCAVRFHHWPVFSWLEKPPMRALGLISYTFYLSHLAFIQIAGSAFASPALAVPAALAMTLAFAGASYVLMERHLAALRRSLHGGRSRRLVPRELRVETP